MAVAGHSQDTWLSTSEKTLSPRMWIKSVFPTFNHTLKSY